MKNVINLSIPLFNMHLRPATISDLPLLQRWDEQPQVIAADPNDDWNWQVELSRTFAWREQLIAELNGVPIGFVQIIDPAEEEGHYWGPVAANLRAIDIWIGEKDYLGKGHGTRMMQMALERSFAVAEVELVLIDPLESNTAAIRFYERLGFKPVGRRRFGEDECMVYCIRRSEWLLSRQ